MILRKSLQEDPEHILNADGVGDGFNFPADRGEYPFQVSLGVGDYVAGERAAHSCGATLIHPSVVLTASHCFTAGVGNPADPNFGNFDPLDWVDFYRYDLTDPLADVLRVPLCQIEGDPTNGRPAGCPPHQAYVVRHPEYNPDFGDSNEQNNDITLIPYQFVV